MMSQDLDKIETVIEAAKAGKMFVLVDDEDRENEGDLVIPAAVIGPEHINFMAKYGRGLICLAMDQPGIHRLGLNLMPQSHESRFSTAFTYSIEAREGVTTGISAADRAHTIQVACHHDSNAQHIATPGHVFPLVARQGGVLVRAGHTEAAVDIARMAGHTNKAGESAGVICEIMNDDGEMMRLNELLGFAAHHGLPIGTIADLIAYRRQHDHFITLRHQESAKIPDIGEFDLKIYINEIDGVEHIALTKGKISPNNPIPVRMHRFSFMQDLFLQGDKDNMIKKSLRKIEEMGCGVLVLIREANKNELMHHLHHASEDESDGLRAYGVGAQILLELNVRRMRLLSNHPKPIIGLEGYGLTVEDWLSI